MNDNISDLHATLTKHGYNPPAIKQFREDMRNESNLKDVWNTLQTEGYTPPAFDQFKADMGWKAPVAAPATPAQGQQANKAGDVSPVTTANGATGTTGAAPTAPDVDALGYPNGLHDEDGGFYEFDDAERAQLRGNRSENLASGQLRPSDVQRQSMRNLYGVATGLDADSNAEAYKEWLRQYDDTNLGNPAWQQLYDTYKAKMGDKQYPNLKLFQRAAMGQEPQEEDYYYGTKAAKLYDTQTKQYVDVPYGKMFDIHKDDEGKDALFLRQEFAGDDARERYRAATLTANPMSQEIQDKVLSEGSVSEGGIYTYQGNDFIIDENDGRLHQILWHDLGGEVFKKATGTINTDEVRKSLDVKESIDHLHEQEQAAQDEITRLEEMRAKRMRELDQENNDMPWYLKMIQEGGYHMESYANDPEFNRLSAALRNANAAYNILHDVNTGKTNHFWHSFAQTATDGYTFTNGAADLGDIEALGDAMTRIDAINRKRKTGEKLTRQEEVAEAVIRNAAWKNELTEKYGDYYGAWNTSAKFAVGSLDFGLSFLESNGMMPAFSRGGTALTLKYGRRYLTKAATNGLSKAVLKVTGVTFGSAVAGLAMANTFGGLRTAADVGNRYLGNATIDANGNYKFDGGKSFIQSMYEAEMAQTIESGSEAMGEFLPGTIQVLKGLGLNKIATGLTQIGGTSWYRNYDKALAMAGFHGVGGEALEEYAGWFANAGLVGDNKWSEFLDPKMHRDIWLGCLTTGALLNAPRVAAVGGNTAYHFGVNLNYRRKTNKADRNAAKVVGEGWQDMREQINATENQDMTAMADDIANNAELNDEQKEAALNYIGNLQAWRGYNIGRATMERGEGAEGAEAPASADAQEINQDVNDNVSAGYDAVSADAMNSIKQRFEDAERKASELFGTDMLGEIDRDPVRMVNWTAMTDDEREVAKEYALAKAAYDGVIGRAQDDIDDAIDESNATIDQRVNPTSGMVHPATLKLDDRRVYVVNGNVQMHDDGSMVDTSNSDDSVIVMDAESGKLEWVSPADILSVDDAIEPQQLKNEAAENIAQKLADEAATKIDGELTFAPGDTYSLIDGEGTPVEVSVVQDNGDGTVMASVNGAEAEVMPKQTLQEMADLTNQARYVQEQAYEYIDVPEYDAQNDYEYVDVPEYGQDADRVQGPMPMNGDEPDFMAVSPERGYAYIFSESGLDEATGKAFVDNNVEASKKELEKAKKKEPHIGTSIAKYNKDKAEWQQRVDDAQKAVDYWAGVKAEHDKVAGRRLAEQAERDRIAAEEAARADEALRAEAERKAAEEAKRGANTAGEAVKQKWNDAQKMWGDADEMVLPNGETVKGRYYLVESGGVTASHDVSNNFKKSEGFPVDENGNSVNDRDYERDKDAQQTTRDIANNYDSRAVQSPIVVTNDGVVLSGNGRTMAGELAAAQGTDGAYVDYVRSHARRWGFDEKDVESMQHPRVVFVTDEALQYTAETFAKFNAQEMKGQSKAEQSVKLGKTVDDTTYGRIVDIVNGFEKLSDFYADPNATAEAMRELVDAGVVSEVQLPTMRDGEGLSALGKETLENVLIGKAFEGNPNAVRQISEYKSMRQAVVMALAELSNNRQLGEYSLDEQLAQAIDLAYQARKAGFKHGDKVSMFARQMNFDFFGLEDTVADYNNKTMLMLADVMNDKEVSRLKKCLQVYNASAQDAANGQLDLFSGDVRSKEEIINDVNSLFSNGEETETGRREEGSVSEDGNAGRRNDSKQVSAELVGRSLSKEEAASLIGKMEQNATVAKEMELTPENWDSEFGTDGKIETPIGTVKMSENQYLKMAREGRNGKLGMIKPTLTEPDVIIEEASSAKDGKSERESSYIFVRAFKKADGSRMYYFTSVTIKKDGNEVVISNQEKRPSKILDLLRKGKVLWLRADSAAETSDENQGLYNSQSSISETETEGHVIPQSPSKKKVNSVPAVGSSTNTDAAGVNHGTDNGAAVASGNSPKLSVGKGTQFGVNNQEKEGEKTKEAIAKAEAETDTNPTDAQKEAGNYKKGHVRLDGYDITIENPKGSTRSGKDADGKEWSVTMNNTYGYIRGTEGVDGDHIDVYLSDTPTNGNVYVIDQVNADGSFDEHKVMYGFASAEEARNNYLANYSEGWTGLGTITEVTKEEFKKWIGSSHRKTKPFSEYKNVKKAEAEKKFMLNGEEYTELSILNIVTEHINSVLDDIGSNVGIVELRVIGSRADGTNREDSDLDVLFEYNGKASEDGLFNALNDEPLTINGVKVDINPITKGKSGTIEQFLKRNKDYKKDEQPVSLSDLREAADGGVPQETKNSDERKALIKSIKEAQEKAGAEPLEYLDYMTLEELKEEAELMEAEAAVDSRDEEAYSKLLDKANGFLERMIKKYGDKVNGAGAKKKKAEAKRLVSDDRMAELKAKLKKKLNGQLNVGVDPEMLAIGAELAVGYIERGTIKFAEYAKEMVDAIGDGIRPYLKSFYNAVRDMPEAESYTNDMDSYEDVRKFDVANFDKKTVNAMAAADLFADEQTAEDTTKTAKEQVKVERNEKRKIAESGQEPECKF